MDALRARSKGAIAFTGAGGKSTAMGCLAMELADERPVLLTTTTKLGLDQTILANSHWIASPATSFEGLVQTLDEARTVLVTGPASADESKWTGLDHAQVHNLHEVAHREGASLLIEADGARGRSLKAPAEHEPALPLFVDLVVPLIGLDVLGETLDDRWVHRPDLVAKLLSLPLGSRLQHTHIAELIVHKQGGMKGVPAGVEVRALLNKAETPSRIEYGRWIAERTIESGSVSACVLAALTQEPPVFEAVVPLAGIVLAAGGSLRLEQPKQLIPWKGKPLVWYAVQAALRAGCSPVVVVIGAHGGLVREALAGEPVAFVENPDWEIGQSASVKAGLRAVEKEVEAVVMFLSDMPLVDAELVKSLVQAHRETLSPLVAPRAGGRRGNPVLFDLVTFSALHEIVGDQGGRVLFDHFPVEWVSWDESVLLDIDTQSDLDALRGEG
ncbi:MAG: putative selenium-dependent hydroxylase accessory protein YqeC [Anaerolineales bacterium]|nr:putative selenium-dependent hydroxylase accessory protein YqeC [Anaerolineales bacterium]